MRRRLVALAVVILAAVGLLAILPKAPQVERDRAVTDLVAPLEPGAMVNGWKLHAIRAVKEGVAKIEFEKAGAFVGVGIVQRHDEAPRHPMATTEKYALLFGYAYGAKPAEPPPAQEIVDAVAARVRANEGRLPLLQGIEYMPPPAGSTRPASVPAASAPAPAASAN